jgi:hypothetical protein
MQCCLSRSLCPGVPRDCRRGAMLVQGVEGVVTRGDVIVKDLWRM